MSDKKVADKFGWIKEAVTSIKKEKLQKTNPVLWGIIEQHEQKRQENEDEEKRKYDKARKEAPKRLDFEIEKIREYLLKLFSALKKQGKHLEISHDSIERHVMISDRNSPYFHDIYGWGLYSLGYHDLKGTHASHPPYHETKYKQTVKMHFYLSLNGISWKMTVYPNLHEDSFVIFFDRDYCSSMDELKTTLQKIIEDVLKSESQAKSLTK